jgi:hypothetical protein
MSLVYNENYAHFDMECDCSNAILQLLVDKIEEEGYWTLYEMSFSTYQQPFWFNLKTNLKLIWSIIRGRRFYLYSLLIPKERMEEFKKFVADI